MKVLARTRIFRQAWIRLGDVRILGLELINEEWGESRVSRSRAGEKLIASLYNIASSRTHRVRRDLGEGFFVETSVDGPGHSASDGEGRLKETRMLLCPYPSRLLALTIAYIDGSTETLRVPQDRDFYVYEGVVETKKPWSHILVEAEGCRRVILDTELSRRVIRAS